MRLGEDSRGADAAVFRRADVGAYEGGFRCVPPVLAVEVAGRYEGEPELREKARWYLAAGVRVVWIVLPRSREVIVVTAAGDRRCAPGERLPARSDLPDLAPLVDELFVQISQP